MAKELKGRLAVVTGASSGIGEEYARQLAARGAHLIVVARRLDRLERLAEELERQHGVNVEPVQADLARPDAPSELFEASTKDGRRVHVLINNAGVGLYGPFLDRPLDRQLASMQLNMQALTELCHRFGTHMRAHGEQSFITNVSSLASYQSTPLFAVYSGTKSYVRIFSETLAFELRKTNVQVTCLCPGGTYSEFNKRAGQELTSASDAVMMSAKDVVSAGIHGMLRGQVSVVPGVMNKMAAVFPRFMPSRVAMAIAYQTVKLNVRMTDPDDG